MKLDPLKLRNRREELGYSQRDVAGKSNCCERTIQRAEAGFSVSSENAALIAAALQTKLPPLMLASRLSDDTPLAGKTVTLRRATSGRAIIDRLDQTYMCNMECDVEPTEENLELLKKTASLLEQNMPEPLNEEKICWPPKRALAERLDLMAKLNGVLRALEEKGIGIFLSEEWLDVYEPSYDPYGEYSHTFYYRENQEPSGVRAVRIIISDDEGEKLTRPASVAWPVRVALDPDECPF